MKKAAIRYAEILEAGAWVTHQEQEEKGERGSEEACGVRRLRSEDMTF